MSRVKWVMPLGVTGVTPLAAVGPVSVGPSHSGAERSSIEAPHVTVFVDALQSLLQRKAVLRLLLTRPQARPNAIGHRRMASACAVILHKLAYAHQMQGMQWATMDDMLVAASCAWILA